MSGAPVLNYNPEDEKPGKTNARALQQGIVDAGINRREFRTFSINGAIRGFELNRHEFYGLPLATQLYFGCERPGAWRDGYLQFTVHYSGDIAVAASVFQLQIIATRYKDGDVLTPGTGEGQITPTETVPGVTVAKAKYSYTFTARLAVMQDSDYLAFVLTRVLAGDTYVGGVLRVLAVVVTYQPNRRTM